MVGQIEFNGIKSYDNLGFLINAIKIGNPSPILVQQRVAYQNGVYDLSEINGNVAYTTREIKVQFKLEKFETSQDGLNTTYYNLINKFMAASFIGTEMKALKISWIEGIFNARIMNISDFDLLENERIVEVTFIAQPFRRWEDYEGNSKWDTFNFITDVLQTTLFSVSTEEVKTVLNNLSVVRVYPLINCSTPMNVTCDQTMYSLEAGYNEHIFSLSKGKNSIAINSIGKVAGTIEFLWKREVI